MGKLTEAEYSKLHSEMSWHANPWTTPGYHNPAKVRREWRKEVNRWRKALDVIATDRWKLEE